MNDSRVPNQQAPTDASDNGSSEIAQATQQQATAQQAAPQQAAPQHVTSQHAKRTQIVVGASMLIVLGVFVVTAFGWPGFLRSLFDSQVEQPANTTLQTTKQNSQETELATEAGADPHAGHEKPADDQLIITEITEKGYGWLHGDHSHFAYGKVPAEARFLPHLVYDDPNYQLRTQDIQYAVADGYIIKVSDRYYYYPKNLQAVTHVVDQTGSVLEFKVGQGASSSTAQSSRERYTRALTDDGYVFHASDVVEDTGDGFVVRHGDHFHYISKSQLSSAEVAAAQAALRRAGNEGSSTGTHSGNVSHTNSEAGASTGAHTGTHTADDHVPTRPEKGYSGIDYPTSDGFLFDGTNIVNYLANGLVVQHGNHTHYIPYYQLIGSRWEYLIPKTEGSSTNQPSGDDSALLADPNNPADGETTTPTDANSVAGATENDIAAAKHAGITLEDYLARKNHLAESYGVDPSSIYADGDNFVIPHGDHYHTLAISDVDPNGHVFDPHDESNYTSAGAKVLESMGIKEDEMAAIFHADAPHHFPLEADSVEQVKAWLATVKSINLGEIPDPLTRAVLPYLANIETLAVGYTPISDPTPLLQLTSIKHLWISQTGLTNLDFLKKLPNLIGVDVSGLNLTNLDALKELTNLEVVAAAQNPLTDISALANFTHLQALNLDSTQVSSLDALKDARNLKVISIDDTLVSDLSPLAHAQELTRLYAAKTKVRDLSALNKLNKLTTLTLAESTDVDISSLESASLTELDIEHTNTSDLSFVNKLSALITLNAANNHISSLSGVKSFTLESLKLDNNALTTLDGIDQFMQLTTLSADNNQITAIGGGHELLKELHLSNNFIDTLEDTLLYTKLSELYVDHNFITTLKISEKNEAIVFLSITYNPVLRDEHGSPLGLDTISPTYGNLDPSLPVDKAGVTSRSTQVRKRLETLKSAHAGEYEALKTELDAIDAALAPLDDTETHRMELRRLVKRLETVESTVYAWEDAPEEAEGTEGTEGAAPSDEPDDDSEPSSAGDTTLQPETETSAVEENNAETNSPEEHA